MKKSHKGFYQVGAVVLMVTTSLLIGILVWQHWTKRNALITRKQAIENAIQACPFIGLQPVIQPTAAEAELTTLGAVQGPFNPDPERPVWFVKMKGRWLFEGGPLPDPKSNPEPSYWDECTIIIDARTGKSLSAPIE